MQDLVTDSGTEPFKLPAILDLAAAEGFLASMRQRLQNGGPLVIDASDSETLTYPCIQIILAAMKTCNEVSIASPSVAFVSAFEDLGLDWMRMQGQTKIEGQSLDNIEQQVADQGGIQDEALCLYQNQPSESDMAKRILTIDDSKTMRDMLMLTLVEAGFDVLQAVDGQDGLDVLSREQVDVIITDINMPKMDGYEVIRQVRSNTEYKRMPILVLTTESEAEKKNLARAAGATGWMVKPFDPDQLIATVRKVSP